jgi:hypothetical protein
MSHQAPASSTIHLHLTHDDEQGETEATPRPAAAQRLFRVTPHNCREACSVEKICDPLAFRLHPWMRSVSLNSNMPFFVASWSLLG